MGMLGKPTAAVPSILDFLLGGNPDFLLGGNPKCNSEGPAFPSLTDEAMKCVLLYHVMFSPFFLLCFIVSEVFCKKHGWGTCGKMIL